jgi:two-component system, NarL family, invasion response regulator UvrY
MIKVLVADNHPEVRLGVKAILSGVEDVAGVDEAGSEQDILDKAKKNQYDIIIFEVARPAGNGLDLLQELRRKKYISDDLAELLASNLDLNLDKPIHEKLSDREYQIFILTASGKRKKEIADILSLAKATIGNCLNKIYSKLMISNKSDLVRYAIKNNLMGNEEDRPAPSIE